MQIEKPQFKELDELVAKFKDKVTSLYDYQTSDVEQISIFMNDQLERLKETQLQVDEMLTLVITHGEKTFDETYQSMKIIKEKFETLNKSFGEIKLDTIPYNFKELIDAAYTIGSLNEQQFTRLVELAKAFGGKE
jgi:uncharacterized coiled-coil protein SlyX